MSRIRLFLPNAIVPTALALVAFAANSVLCRLALATEAIGPAAFTAIRLASGAAILWMLVHVRDRGARLAGDWMSAAALFAYAAGFSFAYVSLSTATGALLLFGAVQATMIGRGWWRGERLGGVQALGVALAVAGLGILLLPGATAPTAYGAILMLAAGIAWGAYSLRGRRAQDAMAATAGNFLRALPMLLLLLPWMAGEAMPAPAGVAYAIASGALASGLGYALWYSALPGLQATSAATVQLAVPVIAALAGVVLVDEPLNARIVLAAFAVLGGIALLLRRRASDPRVRASAENPGAHRP